MAYRNLAECVADLESAGHLRRIDLPLSPRLETGVLQRRVFRDRGPALLFTRPIGSRFPMLANLFGTRERLHYIFRHSLPGLTEILKVAADPALALRKPASLISRIPHFVHALTGRTGKAPVLECCCSLRDLPRLISWPKDGGSFITLPLVHSESPDTGKANLGMYRVQLSGNEYAEDEVGLHYQLKRGIGAHHAAALAKGQSLPVHIYVGGPPALTVAAVMPLPEGMSEFMFAGLLGGRRVVLHRSADFVLPVLAEADFFIKGEIMRDLRPEGPFGDHLGYYSLEHDFPALKVTGVWHRKDAIWPFTTVGRPPQEDTVFGDFIHEITGPLAGRVFEGVREIHAVDAAGVHPLLLAIGQERFTPWQPNAARELVTQAMHLLGTSQTALAKYLLIAKESPGLSTRDVSAFIGHMLTHSSFEKDLRFITNVSTDTLDYSGSALNEGSRLIWSAGAKAIRALGTELRSLPDLPPGFSDPLLAAPGIVVLRGKANLLPRGARDSAVEELCARLEAWPEREHFPLWVIVDDADFCAASFDNFLWVTFTRSDPETDIYGAFARVVKKSWQCSPPLVIDARKKPFHAPELEEDPEVVRRLENLAVRNGPLAGLL